MSDGFLGRWSRRKIEAKERVEQEGVDQDRVVEEAPEAADADKAAAGAVEPGAAPLAEEPEALSEEEIAALPPIESLTIDTDITPFLRRGVPKALKNAAMRKIWLLDPAIRDYRDVALDYAYDWNTPGGVPGNAGAITSESARKMLEALLPPEKPKAPSDAPAESPPAPASPAPGEAVAEAPPAESPEAGSPEAESPGAEPTPDENEPVPAYGSAAPARRAALPETGAEEPEILPRRRRNGGATPV